MVSTVTVTGSEDTDVSPDAVDVAVNAYTPAGRAAGTVRVHDPPPEAVVVPAGTGAGSVGPRR